MSPSGDHGKQRTPAPKKQRAQLADTCALYKIAGDAALCCQLTCAYDGVDLFSQPAHTARNKITLSEKSDKHTAGQQSGSKEELRQAKQNKTKQKMSSYLLDYMILGTLIRVNLSYLPEVNFIWNVKKENHHIMLNYSRSWRYGQL